MNMTRENYPDPAKYVALWRKVAALSPSGAYILEADRRGLGHDAVTLKRNFLKALHNRINVRGKVNMQGRRYDDDYQRDLARDQYALRAKLQMRVIVRQWQTDIMRKRFSHLLTRPEDE